MGRFTILIDQKDFLLLTLTARMIRWMKEKEGIHYTFYTAIDISVSLAEWLYTWSSRILDDLRGFWRSWIDLRYY